MCNTWSICSVSPSSCPWHPVSPSLCTSSDGSHLKRNIHQELQMWQRAMTPSSLREIKSRREVSFNYDVSLYLVNLYRTHISPVDAPNASALAMWPTVWIPPSAMTGTPNRRAYSDTLYTAVACDLPHASTVRIMRNRDPYYQPKLAYSTNINCVDEDNHMHW